VNFYVTKKETEQHNYCISHWTTRKSHRI